MLACVRTAAVFGIEAVAVNVEVDVSFGLPMFTMVGLPDTSVRESRDRVRAAIRNCGFEFPSERVTVNLAPADVRKAGAAFDLPIALGVLAAAGVVQCRAVDAVVLIGELSLDGAIQAARGVLPIAVAARAQGATTLLLPAPNAAEAGVVAGLRIWPVTSLTEAVRVLNNPASADLLPRPIARVVTPATQPDLSEVRGQALARRALEIAAAGRHHLLLVGPPGGGKTMLARRVPGILPALTFDESLESSAIHSVAGTLPVGAGLLPVRPFRAPHHTISDVALAGGGTIPRPGEISLAHNGVLFLDEMPEFDRRALEVLRQPLELGTMTVARSARTAIFPARFMLIGAMNPCPCGMRGHPTRECRCTPQQVARYCGRLSGPLRDRIDLIVDVPAVSSGALATAASGESSADVRARVEGARAVQAERHRRGAARVNSDLDGRALARWCALDVPGAALLAAAAERLALSPRAYDRVLKVARTIADLAATEQIGEDHVAEAIQYRVDVLP
jgi:magnesium chelatase family protein